MKLNAAMVELCSRLDAETPINPIDPITQLDLLILQQLYYDMGMDDTDAEWELYHSLNL